MSQRDRIVDAVKLELKRQGKTYADLTSVLQLSHASVKRLFAERNFSLERLDSVCEFLGLDFTELAKLAEQQAEKIDQLTVDQELEFVKDVKFLCFAHALLNHWSFEEIVDTYEISEHEGIRMMAALDRMKLIEMFPGNRYKLLISRKFGWIKAGPIQNFFETRLQSEFFNSSFNKEDEGRYFVSSMLSAQSRQLVLSRIARLAGEVNDMHIEDEKLPLNEKRGVSLVLAFRPWETEVFSALRRKKIVADFRR